MMKCFFVFSCVLLFTPINVFCQEFLNEKVMKLAEISEDKNYGITEDKSIKVGSIENEYKYINALTGPNGEIIKASRLKSCCPFKSKNKPEGNAYLDVWQLTYHGLREPIIIYLNSYDFDNPKCIKGLIYKKKEQLPLPDNQFF